MEHDSVAAPMPPHGPANMRDLFMTRYDYDYNRDPLKTYPHDQSSGTGGNDDAWISGEVRNRPPFCMGGDWNGDTTYHQDYVPKSRFIDDMNEVHRRIGTEPASTVFIRDWYRPDLTKNADDVVPQSEYKTEYTNSGRIPKGKPLLYAGAPSVPYKEDFFQLKGGIQEDDGSDLPPKITSEESLKPRHKQMADDEVPWKAKEELLPSRRGQLHSLPADPRDYWCTSWTYGDTSKAYPSQLPQGIEGSKRADLVGTMTDKAELLRLLAGRDAKAARTPYSLDDDTNPIFISSEEQRHCAISHRLENEGHVKRTQYASDYINQYRLPELPGNHGASDVRNTTTTSHTSAGAMACGKMTQHSRDMGSLRNSHGYMKRISDCPKPLMPPEVLSTLRSLEKASDVDKADPHRHKMHKERS